MHLYCRPLNMQFLVLYRRSVWCRNITGTWNFKECQRIAQRRAYLHFNKLKAFVFLWFKTVKFCYTLAQTSLLISWFKGESALIMNINLVSEENIRDDMIFLAQSCQTLSIWLFPWHIEDVTFFSYPAFLSCSDAIQGTKECGNDVFKAKENFPFCVFLWRFCREGEAR